MTVNGILQIVVYLVVLVLLVKPLGAYMASVYEGRSRVNRVFGPVERLLYRMLGVRQDDEMNWKTYALAALLLQHARRLCRVYAAAGARWAAAQSAKLRRRLARFLIQHGGQLCHQHKLAGVCRRDHHELPYTDGWPCRAELRLCRHRDGRADRLDSRHFAPHGKHDRQLLGGPHTHDPVYPAAAVRRVGPGFCLAGNDSKPRPLSVGAARRAADRRRRQRGDRTDAGDGSRSIATGHQTFGHQRRRLFQCQLCPPVRKSNPSH